MFNRVQHDQKHPAPSGSRSRSKRLTLAHGAANPRHDMHCNARCRSRMDCFHDLASARGKVSDELWRIFSFFCVIRNSKIVPIIG